MLILRFIRFFYEIIYFLDNIRNLFHKTGIRYTNRAELFRISDRAERDIKCNKKRLRILPNFSRLIFSIQVVELCAFNARTLGNVNLCRK